MHNNDYSTPPLSLAEVTFSFSQRVYIVREDDDGGIVCLKKDSYTDQTLQIMLSGGMYFHVEDAQDTMHTMHTIYMQLLIHCMQKDCE